MSNMQFEVKTVGADVIILKRPPFEGVPITLDFTNVVAYLVADGVLGFDFNLHNVSLFSWFLVTFYSAPVRLSKAYHRPHQAHVRRYALRTVVDPRKKARGVAISRVRFLFISPRRRILC